MPRAAEWSLPTRTQVLQLAAYVVFVGQEYRSADPTQVLRCILMLQSSYMTFGNPLIVTLLYGSSCKGKKYDLTSNTGS